MNDVDMMNDEFAKFARLKLVIAEINKLEKEKWSLRKELGLI